METQKAINYILWIIKLYDNGVHTEYAIGKFLTKEINKYILSNHADKDVILGVLRDTLMRQHLMTFRVRMNDEGTGLHHDCVNPTTRVVVDVKPTTRVVVERRSSCVVS